MTIDLAVLTAFSLLWKTMTTAAIVIMTGRLARHAGPVLTGVLIALPVNAGPGLFFVSLAVDKDFVVQSVLYSMAGAGAVLIYLTMFVQFARLGNFYAALVLGLACWTIAAWVIAALSLDLMTALSCVIAGAIVAVLFNRKPAGVLKAAKGVAAWRYLLVRGVVAGILIAVLATFAEDIGPVIAGLLLSFPTTLSTTGWMLSGHYGLDFVAATYAAARKALSLYVSFCLIVLALLAWVPGPLAVLVAFAVVAVIGALFAMVFLRMREVRGP